MISRRLFLTLPGLPLAATAQADGFTPVREWEVVDGPESAFVVSGDEIAVQEHASMPCWLRSAAEFENFELRGEFFIKGWTDSGIYLHAATHGRPTLTGMQIKVFHDRKERPAVHSMGAIFPVVAPRLLNVREGWNDFRIVMDWPRLQVEVNGENVQDVDCDKQAELKHRLRRGHIGIAGASAQCAFRKLRVRELPGKETLVPLFTKDADYLANWAPSEGKPDVRLLGGILRLDGSGHIATKERFRDFELFAYVRTCAQHNGGVLFRTSGRGLAGAKYYEIQLHNVEEARFPTGSLYHYKRSIYPRIEDEKWFPLQLRVEGSRCMVRINGETVMEYDGLENREAGKIELQAHRSGYWAEFKQIRVKRLSL